MVDVSLGCMRGKTVSAIGERFVVGLHGGQDGNLFGVFLCRPLCRSHKRPYCRCAAKHLYEIAPPHLGSLARWKEGSVTNGRISRDFHFSAANIGLVYIERAIPANAKLKRR